MEKYVNYLIEDMRAAERPPVVPVDLNLDEEWEFDIDQHLSEIKRYFDDKNNPNKQTFSFHTGLKRESFPPVNKLNNSQLGRICVTFVRLLKSWNLHPVMPEGLPVQMMYEPLIGILDTPVAIVKQGGIDIEFCEYEPTECIFKEFCSCKEWVDDEDFDMGQNTRDFDPDELPF